MEYCKLANGNRVPMIAFGTWGIFGAEAAESVCTALQLGYRSIDTAMFYNNEREVGEGIRNSGVPREEIFLASKIWHTDLAPEKVRPAYEQSLSNLGVDYLDLFLVHWPLNDYIGGWKVLQQMRDEGIVRNIGFCNCQIHHLEEIKRETGEFPVINQIETNPRFQQQKLVDYCRENGVAVEAWGPLGKGKILTDPVICSLAEKYGKTAAQIVLRWQVQRGIISLPKSVHADRMKGNLQVFDFELPGEDMEAINALETGKTDRGYMPDYVW